MKNVLTTKELLRSPINYFENKRLDLIIFDSDLRRDDLVALHIILCALKKNFENTRKYPSLYLLVRKDEKSSKLTIAEDFIDTAVKNNAIPMHLQHSVKIMENNISGLDAIVSTMNATKKSNNSILYFSLKTIDDFLLIFEKAGMCLTEEDVLFLSGGENVKKIVAPNQSMLLKQLNTLINSPIFTTYIFEEKNFDKYHLFLKDPNSISFGSELLPLFAQNQTLFTTKANTIFYFNPPGIISFEKPSVQNKTFHIDTLLNPSAVARTIHNMQHVSSSMPQKSNNTLGRL